MRAADRGKPHRRQRNTTFPMFIRQKGKETCSCQRPCPFLCIAVITACTNDPGQKRPACRDDPVPRVQTIRIPRVQTMHRPSGFVLVAEGAFCGCFCGLIQICPKGHNNQLSRRTDHVLVQNGLSLGGTHRPRVQCKMVFITRASLPERQSKCQTEALWIPAWKQSCRATSAP